MLSGRNILIWCIDPAYTPFRFIDKEFISNCNYFIPVYCFDERMKTFAENSIDPSQFAINAISKVKKLRFKLRTAGSDLLIVNGSFEIIIPSLARVLQANQVIVLIHEEKQGFDPQEKIEEFRSDKIRLTGELLSRHSIDFKVIKSEHQQVFGRNNLSFPPFPEIETGTVPQY